MTDRGISELVPAHWCADHCLPGATAAAALAAGVAAGVGVGVLAEPRLGLFPLTKRGGGLTSV